MSDITMRERGLDRLIDRLDTYSHEGNVLTAFEDPMMVVGYTVAARAKANVLATPSKRQNAKRGKPSLRRGISDAIQVRKEHIHSATMVNVFVNTSQMPAGRKGLGSLYEGVSEWHHPVYRHEPIVNQMPHPYMAPSEHGVYAGLEAAAEKTALKIATHIG